MKLPAPLFAWMMFSITFLTPHSFVCGDGLIVVHPPWGRPGPHPMPIVPPGHFSFAPLEVVSHQVTVDIRDLTATTSVDQVFRNPNNTRLEGTYVFPLPQGAHIDKFSTDVNGVMTDAELLSADKARALYEEIVRSMKDPALLEYAGREAFKVRIFPIEPLSTKRVKISYTQLLKKDGEIVDYVYPLSTEKFSAALIPSVSVKVTLDGAEPLKTLYCPTHEMEIRREGTHKAVLGFEGKNIRPDTDLKIVFARSPSPLAIQVLTQRSGEGEGIFLLLASPGVSAPDTPVPAKDLCLVLDTSGSMAGKKMEQARAALLFCLDNLNHQDRFELLRFSTEAEPFFQELTPATPENIEQAKRFLESLKPIGGTAIGEAMEKAMALRADEDGRPYQIVFITDGLPTIGETRQDPLVEAVKKSRRPHTRVFTFGLGKDVNTHLLDQIATATRAVSSYVLPEEDLEVKLSAFYQKISQPVMSNLSVDFGDTDVRVTQLHPNVLPDIFYGEQLVVFGRYTGHGPAEVRISGMFNGKEHSFRAPVRFAEKEVDNPYIPHLWATRRVGWLLDEIRLRGESQELKEEVARLAREYGIVTPYTAYLIIEDERRREVPMARRNLQELEADASAYRFAAEKVVSLRTESQSEAARSGQGALENAMDISALSGAAVPAKAGRELNDRAFNQLPKSAAAAPPASAGYRAQQTQTYAQQNRVLNGRSFFQNGKVWIDSTAQALKNADSIPVDFHSEEYFALLKKHPEAAPWFSLGSDLDLVLDHQLYSIRSK